MAATTKPKPTVPNSQSGKVGKSEDAKPVTVPELKKVAMEYHVPMDDSTLESIVKDNTDNPHVLEAFTEFVKMSAASLYPTLAKAILAGLKTGHLLSPYAETKKIMLGPDAKFDPIGNPIDGQALTGGTDPATGTPAPMGLNQFQNHLKTEPSYGWQKTPAAHAVADQLINRLHQGLTQEQGPE